MAETFAMLGRDEEAQAAKRLHGTSARTASPALAELLAALLPPPVDY